MPRHLESLLPEDHRARLVWGYVVHQDLGKLIEAGKARGSNAGRAAIDPRILFALWLYATLDGVGSGREVARLSLEHDAYRWICGDVSVNYHALNDFRAGNEALMDELLGDREYAVMVTDVAYALGSIGQLYRDRADCENGFDELKNQWGMSGFTTQDINHCQTTARACALVYNWRSWYCRAANPTARMEAPTSCPLLLAAVGRAVSHAGQTMPYLTPMHGKTHILKQLIANIRTALQHVRATAEQFRMTDTWAVPVRYVSDRIAPVLGPFRPPVASPTTG